MMKGTVRLSPCLKKFQKSMLMYSHLKAVNTTLNKTFPVFLVSTASDHSFSSYGREASSFSQSASVPYCCGFNFLDLLASLINGLTQVKKIFPQQPAS